MNEPTLKEALVNGLPLAYVETSSILVEAIATLVKVGRNGYSKIDRIVEIYNLVI